MNRLLDVWEALLSFSKYFLSNAFSQNIGNCSEAFSLLFGTVLTMLTCLADFTGKFIKSRP